MSRAAPRSAPGAARSRSGRPSTCAPGSAPRAMPPSGSRSGPRATWCSTCPSPGSARRALFTRQIDDAMLDGRIDLAVHSLKDLPTTLPDGIALVAVGEREDPRDALVGRGPLAWESCRGAPCSPPAASAGGRSCSMSGPTSQVVRHPRQRGHPARQARRERASGPASCSPRRGSCGSASARPDRRAAAARGHAAGARAGGARGHRARWRRRRRRRPRARSIHHGRPRSPSPRSARSSARSRADARCRWRRSRSSPRRARSDCTAGSSRLVGSAGSKELEIGAVRPTSDEADALGSPRWRSGCSRRARRRSWRRCGPAPRPSSRSPDAGDGRRHRVGRHAFRGWSRRCGRFRCAVEDAR